MKRVAAIVLVILIVFSMLTLVACADRECDRCGYTHNVREHRRNGERFLLCRDCYREISFQESLW